MHYIQVAVVDGERKSKKCRAGARIARERESKESGPYSSPTPLLKGLCVYMYIGMSRRCRSLKMPEICEVVWRRYSHEPLPRYMHYYSAYNAEGVRYTIVYRVEYITFRLERKKKECVPRHPVILRCEATRIDEIFYYPLYDR